MKKVKIVQDTDKKNMRDEYQNTVTTLTQIKDAQSLTQAQATQAVKDTARVLLLLIKMYARTL